MNSVVQARRLERGYSSRLRRVRERTKNSFWVIPALFLVAAVVLSGVFRAIDAVADSLGVWIIAADRAEILLAGVSGSTLTFVAILFSMTLVALQLASRQMSPRVLQIFARSNITKLTLGFFMATFTFGAVRLAMLELSSDPEDETSPAYSVLFAVALALGSFAMFLVFANRIVNLMRVSWVIDHIAAETLTWLGTSFPKQEAYVSAQRPTLQTSARIVLFERARWSPSTSRARHGILFAVDRPRLVSQATANDGVFRLIPRIGSYVAEGTPVMEIHGPNAVPTETVISALDIGSERNVYQDTLFGLRQLVDISGQALAPGVNAPTTAVQALHRLQELVLQIGLRPMPSGFFADPENTVRFIEPTPTWDDVVDLAFTEIRINGARSPQVTRRLAAAIDHLLGELPQDRHAALKRHRKLLEARVDRLSAGSEEASVALESDELGLG